jgi:hypothetical protein
MKKISTVQVFYLARRGATRHTLRLRQSRPDGMRAAPSGPGGSMVRLFSAKNLSADVGPEFLEDVVQHSGFHLRSKVPRGLT